jgi:hypothetical protein
MAEAVVARSLAVHVGFVLGRRVLEHVLSKYFGFSW